MSVKQSVIGEINIGQLTIYKKKIKGPKSRQGISLVGLPTSYKTILEFNKVIAKYKDDDRFLAMIFYTQKTELNNKRLHRIYYNPETNEISSKTYIKKQFDEYPWLCAYCQTPIMSKLNNITASNFTCERCFKIYIKNSKEINSRIVDSSYRFTQEVKEKIKKQNKKLIKYIARNNEKQI